MNRQVPHLRVDRLAVELVVEDGDWEDVSLRENGSALESDNVNT